MMENGERGKSADGLEILGQSRRQWRGNGNVNDADKGADGLEILGQALGQWKGSGKVNAAESLAPLAQWGSDSEAPQGR